MNYIQGIILGFLLGSILVGLIIWQLTSRRSMAKYENELSVTKTKWEQELSQTHAKWEQELTNDAQSIWHFLQHELKQPVATVRLALGRLEPNITTGKGQDIINELNGQFELFSDLTEACRTYAEFLKSGTAHTEIVSIDKILQEVKKSLLTYNPGCKIELYFNDLTGPILVEANPDQMRVIFRNLLDNAWNYSNRVKPIRVDANCAQGEVVVDVRNDGKGIDNETMAAILEKGGRVDTSIPGSGLGLLYTNRIIQANGGKLIPEKQFGGQLMRVVLPAAPVTELDSTSIAPEPS